MHPMVQIASPQDTEKDRGEENKMREIWKVLIYSIN